MAGFGCVVGPSVPSGGGLRRDKGSADITDVVQSRGVPTNFFAPNPDQSHLSSDTILPI